LDQLWFIDWGQSCAKREPSGLSPKKSGSKKKREEGKRDRLRLLKKEKGGRTGGNVLAGHPQTKKNSRSWQLDEPGGAVLEVDEREGPGRQHRESFERDEGTCKKRGVRIIGVDGGSKKPPQPHVRAGEP